MRAIEKKRPPFMTRKKWILFSVFILLSIIVLLTLFYRNIQLSMWDEQAQIKSTAMQQETIKSVESLRKYTWDSSYWIISSTDHNDQQQYVAFQENELLAAINRNNIVSEQEMLEKIAQLTNQKDTVSVQAGYAWNMFVWEVHYLSDKDNRYKYAFYEMSSGNFIDEYTLPNRTSGI